MHTDEHRYEGLAENGRFTRRVKEGPGQKSVFICVHLWFMNSLSGFNCGIQGEDFGGVVARHPLTPHRPYPRVQLCATLAVAKGCARFICG